MKRNVHVMVHAARIRPREGAEASLACYQFGTRTARHLFCKVCGVTSYYVPRSNPDGFGVTVSCIDAGTVGRVEVRERARADDCPWGEGTCAGAAEGGHLEVL